MVHENKAGFKMNIDDQIKEHIKEESSRIGERSGLAFMLTQEEYNGCFYELKYK